MPARASKKRPSSTIEFVGALSAKPKALGDLPRALGDRFEGEYRVEDAEVGFSRAITSIASSTRLDADASHANRTASQAMPQIGTTAQPIASSFSA